MVVKTIRDQLLIVTACSEKNQICKFTRRFTSFVRCLCEKFFDVPLFIYGISEKN